MSYRFPPQDDAIQAVRDAVRTERVRNTGKTLFVFGAYSIGKEKIFLEIAKCFGVKIYVTPDKMRILKHCMTENDLRSIEAVDR